MANTTQPKKCLRIRRFCFTLNNWTEEEYKYLVDSYAPTTAWGVVGKETGENGTPHLQGAVVIGAQWTLTKLKGVLCFKRAHIEVMKGSPKDSLAYCTKQDANAYQWGTMPQQGKRNDLHEVVSRIRNGDTLRALAQDDQGGVAIVKYHKGLTVLRSVLREPRTEPPLVIWCYGPTGTGKTRCSMESAAFLLSKLGRSPNDVWISAGNLRWFDGYDGQFIAVLDDFRAKHAPNFAFMLRLTDRYQMSVEFKGGFANWDPRVIFITCPYEPDTCFRKRKEHVPEDIVQFKRRVSAVFEFEAPLTDVQRGEFATEILRLWQTRNGGPVVVDGAEDSSGHNEGED